MIFISEIVLVKFIPFILHVKKKEKQLYGRKQTIKILYLHLQTKLISYYLYRTSPQATITQLFSLYKNNEREIQGHLNSYHLYKSYPPNQTNPASPHHLSPFQLTKPISSSRITHYPAKLGPISKPILTHLCNQMKPSQTAFPSSHPTNTLTFI